MHPLQLLKPIIGEGEGGERSLRVHHRRSMQLVEGEKEGREVGKVVKSHCAGQPGGGKSPSMLNGYQEIILRTNLLWEQSK